MNTISHNLTRLRQQIIAAERCYGRKDGSVKLLAISKTQPLAAIQDAIAAGQQVFGENYVQEAVQKISALREYNLEWHFVGAVQTNKTKMIAENFSWVHGIDRLNIAARLNSQRPADLPALNICLQVNLDHETNKAGIAPEALTKLALEVAKLPKLKLRGLMAIPAPRKEFEQQRQVFRTLRLALDKLQTFGLDLDTLSMGMSDDFEAAIAEGATIVRIGTKIFGSRS